MVKVLFTIAVVLALFLLGLIMSVPSADCHSKKIINPLKGRERPVTERTRISNMRTLLKAVIVGCLFTILLVVLAVIPGAETKIGKAATFLMIPGILIGFVLGSGRVHDIKYRVN